MAHQSWERRGLGGGLVRHGQVGHGRLMRCVWGMSWGGVQIGMKTDRIRTDITDIIFVFIFLVGFGFKYG